MTKAGWYGDPDLGMYSFRDNPQLWFLTLDGFGGFVNTIAQPEGK